MINWAALWNNMFGTTTWCGVDIGFWVSMGISLLVAIIMCVVFWSLRPLKEKKYKTDKNKEE